MPPGLAKKGKMPPGLEKQGKIPGGWEKGQKKGWSESPGTSPQKKKSLIRRVIRVIFRRGKQDPEEGLSSEGQ